LRVFENTVLRGILRHRRDEVIGDWKKLHNEDLHNLYSSRKVMLEGWTVFFWFRIGHSNESFVSIEGAEFLD
jgi:hypothetical protein